MGKRIDDQVWAYALDLVEGSAVETAWH